MDLFGGVGWLIDEMLRLNGIGEGATSGINNTNPMGLARLGIATPYHVSRVLSPTSFDPRMMIPVREWPFQPPIQQTLLQSSFAHLAMTAERSR